MGRPRDESLIHDFDRLRAQSPRDWVDVKVSRHHSRRSVRLGGVIAAVDDDSVTLMMATEDFRITRRNFLNFRVRPAPFSEGDFVIQPELPNWRGVVLEVDGPWVECLTQMADSTHDDVVERVELGALMHASEAQSLQIASRDAESPIGDR